MSVRVEAFPVVEGCDFSDGKAVEALLEEVKAWSNSKLQTGLPLTKATRKLLVDNGLKIFAACYNRQGKIRPDLHAKRGLR